MLINTMGERKKYLMDNFIEVYDGAVPKDICEYFIEFFDKEHELGNTKPGESGGNGVRIESKDCLDLNVKLNNGPVNNEEYFSSKHKKIIDIYDDLVDEKFYEYLTHYYPTRPWKDEKGYLFRHRDLAPEQKLDGLMHVYEPPLQGYHVFHEDWNSMQLLWASRMLIGMVYLNDVWVGGETEFLHQKVKIKPKQGTLVVWPAYFTHLHRGNPPISNRKYIINKWCLPI